MAVRKFCSRDPLLDFIHETFGATVIRLPDPRWRPLTLFRGGKDRIRYLGLVADLAQSEEVALPSIENVNLPTIEFHKSSFVEWRIAADLLGPILEHLIGATLGAVNASFRLARGKSTRASLSLARTRRSFVPPIAVAKWIDAVKPAIPKAMRADLKSDPVSIVDSVLLARKLNVLLEGQASAEVTAKLAAALGPKLSADNIVATDSRLSIEVPHLAPFAFTAIEVCLDDNGVLRDIRTGRGPVRAAAAPIELLSPLNRPALAGADEIVDFDG